ncbi:hypothetical protein HD554DRAFT_2178069 [Boletus coccyginus]|nr:hypothetical protein HD554DRAFT_2178069 [Boletus coccyginus]
MVPNWLGEGFWSYAASEIVNEQALEALAQPSTTSDNQFWGDNWNGKASTILEEQASKD